jgi:hypothetical protein
MVPQPKVNQNPLAGFMRQPKIYIKLPSGGEFWPAGSLDKTENGEYPVYSMTAKDELMLKVPDALMNGQAVVSVIEHCIPNIKNAWQTPNLDLDVILIAIRIATYGDTMTIPVRLQKGEEFDYNLNLNTLMDTLMNQVTWQTAIPVSPDLTVHVRPINYKQMTDSALKTFETQKIFDAVNNQDLPVDEKAKVFNESFEKLSQITIGIVNNSVFAIESSAGTTDNPAHLKEFMENSDKEIFDTVKKYIETLRENNTIKPLKVQTTEQMRESGVVEDEVEIPLIFDASYFFA